MVSQLENLLMSHEMFVFHDPYYQNSSSNMLSPEISENLFTDPLSALSDSSIDSILQEISDDHNQNINTSLKIQISADEAQSLDQIAQTLFSNSPPSHQLDTLSLSEHQNQQTHLAILPNSCNLASGLDNYSVSAVKTEDFHLGFDSPSCSYLLGNYNNNDSYGGSGAENAVKFMQRSYSSNSVESKASGLLFQLPRFDTLFEPSQSFQTLGSPEVHSTFSTFQIRRVCSTGNLPEVRMNQTAQQRVSTSSTGEDGNFMEESNLKVGKYSPEARKERIHRYRAKRTQRNFNKTIKYACRKTLADNRTRIRGRFARNDDPGPEEIPKPTFFHPNYQDNFDLYSIDNLQEQEGGGIIIIDRRQRERFLSTFGGAHFQY